MQVQILPVLLTDTRSTPFEQIHSVLGDAFDESPFMEQSFECSISDGSQKDLLRVDVMTNPYVFECPNRFKPTQKFGFNVGLSNRAVYGEDDGVLESTRREFAYHLKQVSRTIVTELGHKFEVFDNTIYVLREHDRCHHTAVALCDNCNQYIDLPSIDRFWQSYQFLVAHAESCVSDRIFESYL